MTKMPRVEWTEMDEQMAREGQARIRSFKSVGQPKRSGQDRDSLKPNKHRVLGQVPQSQS